MLFYLAYKNILYDLRKDQTLHLSIVCSECYGANPPHCREFLIKNYFTRCIKNPGRFHSSLEATFKISEKLVSNAILCRKKMPSKFNFISFIS